MTEHFSFLALVEALILTVVLVNLHLRRLCRVWLLSDGSSAPAGTAHYVATGERFKPQGLNPYGPASLRQVQDLTISFSEAQQHWNPAWMLVMMGVVRIKGCECRQAPF